MPILEQAYINKKHITRLAVYKNYILIMTFYSRKICFSFKIKRHSGCTFTLYKNGYLIFGSFFVRYFQKYGMMSKIIEQALAFWREVYDPIPYNLYTI